LDPPYDIKFVFVLKIAFLGKSTKTTVTRAALFDPNMHQRCPTLPDPLTVFRWPTSKRRGEWGREFVLCRRKEKLVKVGADG